MKYYYQYNFSLHRLSLIVLLNFFLFILNNKVLGETENCLKETEKYGNCTSIEIDFTSLNKIQMFCEEVDQEECKAFTEDITKTTTSCDFENNRKDFYRIKHVMYVRLNYLSYCVKDNNGNYCPYATLLRNFEFEIENNITKSEAEWDKEDEIINIENCKIKECNQYFISLANNHRINNEIYGLSMEEGLILQELLPYYENGNCDDIKYVYSEENGAPPFIKKIIPVSTIIVSILFLLTL